MSSLASYTQGVAQRIPVQTPDASSRGCRGDAASFVMNPTTGVVVEYPTVTSVKPGSPAAMAGLQAGDAITRFDGRDSREAGGRRFAPGDSVHISFNRGNVKHESVLVFGQKDAAGKCRPYLPASPASSPDQAVRSCRGDAVAIDMNRETGEVVAYPAVTSVQPGSPAAIAGLQVGDVITMFDGRDSREAGTRRFAPGDSVQIAFSRGGVEHEGVLIFGQRNVVGECRPYPPRSL